MKKGDAPIKMEKSQKPNVEIKKKKLLQRYHFKVKTNLTLSI